MQEYFKHARAAITKALNEIQKHYEQEYNSVSADLGSHSVAALTEFSLRGKMIRGCLVRLGFELCLRRGPAQPEETAIAWAGAAMELLQSGLLIHDDIMDRDTIRRGKPTIYAAYADLLRRGKYQDHEHNGMSLGICAGDLAYFMAFEILSSLTMSPAITGAIATATARELSKVGVAQMQDVCNGAVQADSYNPFRPAPAQPDAKGIIQLFRYKTGRYTFSLPLGIGARIADADHRAIQSLETAGESLGILFQIKDDELGLFADPTALGKPVGADIRENKKTLYRHYLFERADATLKAKLLGWFGSPNVDNAAVDTIRQAIIDLGVRSDLKQQMEELAVSTRQTLASLADTASPAARQTFNDLIEYSLNREF